MFVSVGSSDHTGSFFGDCCCDFTEIAQWIILILPDKQIIHLYKECVRATYYINDKG